MQKYLITDELTATEKGYTFADEADMLNVANIRDYASAEKLIILVNMESQNAELIKP